MNAEQPPVNVFISYSHDSPEHAARVLMLSNRLRADGVDAMIDQYAVPPPEDWTLWMEKQIRDADFVLMVCTATYRRRVMGEETPGTGLGVRWEGKIIYQHIYHAEPGTVKAKFIPVLLEGGKVEHIPLPVKGAMFYQVDSEEHYESLYRHITGQPRTVMPELGTTRPLPPHDPRIDLFSTKTDDKPLQVPQVNDSERQQSLRHIDGLGGQKPPFALHQKIIEFLTSLPNIHDSNTQRALIYNARLDTQLQNQINFAGPPAQFFQLLVPTLSSYGKLEDGRTALEAVLEAAKQNVGKDKREYCDTLIQELRAISNVQEYRPQCEDFIGKKPEDGKKFQEFSQISTTVQNLYQQWNEGAVEDRQLTDGVRKALEMIVSKTKAGELTISNKQLRDVEETDNYLILHSRRLEEARSKARRSGLRDDEQEVEKRERIWLNIIREAINLIEEHLSTHKK